MQMVGKRSKGGGHYELKSIDAQVLYVYSYKI